MKKYFAKYLPVEGKIKEGDMYWHSGNSQEGSYQTLNVCHKPYRKIKDREEYFVDGMFATNCQKVKLFLCSRDIQVGDKVVQDKEKPFNPDSLAIIDKEHLEMHKMYGHFKVIGEISSDAIWVKEGDEFDRPDFEAIWRDELGNLNFCAYDLQGVEQELIIRIKCSQCKTFH